MPWQTRSNRLLPAPFGPMIKVRAGAASKRQSISFKTILSPRRNETFVRVTGNI
jgi:hypothetical protein